MDAENGRSENGRPTPKKNLFLGLPFLALPFSVDPDERLPEKIIGSAVALEQRYARPRCLRAKYDTPGRRIVILPIRDRPLNGDACSPAVMIHYNGVTKQSVIGRS